MRQVFLLAMVFAVLAFASCVKETPTTAPPTPTSEAVEEVVVPDLTAELALEVGEMDELDLDTLLSGSEELTTDIPGLEVPEVDTTLDLSDLVESTLE